MLIHFDAFIAMISTASAIVGYKTSIVLSSFVSDIAGSPMPEWMQWIVGPLGSVAALGIALWWMSRRLEAAEKRSDERERNRDARIETLQQANTELAQASLRVTDRVGRAIEAIVEELDDRPCGLGISKSKLTKIRTNDEQQ